jgi:hypothetical protein
MEYIKIKLSTSKKIFEHIKSYYDKLYPILLEKFKDEIIIIENKLSNEKEYNIIKKYIHKLEDEDLINTEIDKIKIHFSKLLNKNEIYDDIFNLFKYLQNYIDNISYLINKFDTPKFNTEYMSDINVSQTHKIEISDEFNIVKDMYIKFILKNKDLDSYINKFLSQIILIIFKVKNNILFSDYKTNKGNNKDIWTNQDNNNKTDNSNKKDKTNNKNKIENQDNKDNQDKTNNKEDYFALDENLLNSIIEIREYFIQNTNIIDLYIIIMITLNNELKKILIKNKNWDIKYSCKKNIHKISEMIEQDKLLVLKENTNLEKKIPSKINKIYNKNPPIKNFGFIPSTNLFSMSELIKIIFKLENLSAKIDLETFSKLHNCGFIIINKITPNPIEYNIKKLTDKNLFEPTTYGITSKFLNKTNTINQLDNTKWNFSYEIYPKSILNENENIIAALKFYVIETLDGINYRCMTKTMVADQYKLAYINVKNLLNHIKNNNLIYPTRIDYYQNIIINKSIPNMFLLKKLPLEPIEQESKVDSGLIRNTLFINLCKIFDQLKNKIKNNNDFNDVIHNDAISNEFVRSIIELYQSYIKSEIDKFPFSEIFITYLAELKKIASMFIRELHDNYNRDPLTNFSYSHEIREKFENMLKKSLEYIITNKSNIYQIISYKNLLLNF